MDKDTRRRILIAGAIPLLVRVNHSEVNSLVSIVKERSNGKRNKKGKAKKDWH